MARLVLRRWKTVYLEFVSLIMFKAMIGRTSMCWWRDADSPVPPTAPTARPIAPKRRDHKIVWSLHSPSPLRPNGLLSPIPEASGSGSGVDVHVVTLGSNSGVAALGSRTDVEVGSGLGSGDRIRQRSGESYLRDQPQAKRLIVAALQKELASVNERKERLNARKERLDARKVRLEAKKERLEELIVEFTSDEEEEEEDW